MIASSLANSGQAADPCMNTLLFVYTFWNYTSAFLLARSDVYVFLFYFLQRNSEPRMFQKIG